MRRGTVAKVLRQCCSEVSIARTSTMWPALPDTPEDDGTELESLTAHQPANAHHYAQIIPRVTQIAIPRLLAKNCLSGGNDLSGLCQPGKETAVRTRRGKFN